jgi:general secretion pathway protein F
MPSYHVQLHEPGAAPQWRLVQAPDEAALPAVLGLPASRLLAVRPNADRAEASAGGPGTGWLRQRGPRVDPRAFAQELAVLLASGVPLLEAVETLAERNGDAAVPLARVQAGLREGRTLSQAMAAAGDDGAPAFDDVLLALVAAAERDGQLVGVLKHHAEFLAWSGALRDRLVAAALYPAMLLATGVAVIGFLVVFVLPRLAGVFEGMAVELPWGSRVLIAAGQAAAREPWLAALLALLLPLAVLVGLRAPAARRWWQAQLWRLPALGPRLRTVALARLYRAVGLLGAAGVPLPRALALAEPVLDAPLRPALAQARADVAAGGRLSAALQGQGLLTPAALRMLRVGERSGEVAAMLTRAAAFHDEEVSRLADWVSKVVNPVLMLVMGAVVGGVVVLMYLPLFTLMEQVP